MHRDGAFFFVVCAGLIGTAFLLPRPAAADWPAEPNVNVALSAATGSQGIPTLVSDGAGGAIATWNDPRNGNSDIYAQRLTVGGVLQWTIDGAPVCVLAGDQQGATLSSDGAGGAIVAWFDWRSGSNYDIYAQRILAGGTPAWTANGVAVCANSSNQQGAAIVPDGESGAIIAWTDYRAGTTDIYAQRISAEGAVLWTDGGVPLCTATGNQQSAVIVSDSAGGAVVVWTDYRDGEGHLYTQRISAEGAVQWTADGVALCTATSGQYALGVVSDGTGGAIASWHDSRNGNGDIFAQRISGDGTVQWATDGVALCSATLHQYYPSVVPDEVGGAIVTWIDARSGVGNWDIYAQRISAEGAPLWTANGVALCTATNEQQRPVGVADGAGGVIVTWWDLRSGTNYDLYSQLCSEEGTPQWAANGVALCTVAGDQKYPAGVADGMGGAIIGWQDYRSNTNYDIYAQRIWADGTTPVLLSFAGAEVGADFVSLTWFASGSGSAVATVYRSPLGGEWTRIGEAAVDGTGYLRYTDPIDATASRVGYRLGIVEAGVESFQGETWVDLPGRGAALAFALEPVRPNPSRGGALIVRFTLPSTAPASIELLDVAGRRVASREVGSLGAGRHTLDFGSDRRLAPGLYLVRLTQGTDSRTTRVAVLR